MKKVCVFLLLTALSSLLWCDIQPISNPIDTFPQYLPGNIATYAKGDTIAYVTIRPTEDNTGGIIYFTRSYDGGQSFFQTTVSLSASPYCKPSLNFNEGQIIVNYVNNNIQYAAISTNGGQIFSNTALFPNYEASPYLERVGDSYRLFGINSMQPQASDMSTATPQLPVYFTDIDASTNDTPVYFWGPDVLDGPIVSNSDIWIKNGGGGTNGGWPTFYGHVTTGGIIQSTSGTPPYASVFRGGYTQGVQDVGLKTSLLDEISPIATNIGDETTEGDIFLVTANGASYDIWLGAISESIASFADVYTSYPPPVDFLYQNTYTVTDTVWTPYSMGSVIGTHVVHGTLWIKGNFAGKSTWYSTQNMYLVGDITLLGTDVGQAPDLQGNTNITDYVALISEKNVIVKYAYKDPMYSLRVHPNCGADGQGINIYASIYALGSGQNSYDDGVFTFEYQHPHPSVPAYQVGDTVYDNIDLHRRHFPQTASAPWPQNIDYPWYNPVWPERQPYKERGTINLWGSIVQRRRGFVHRSVLDSEHPSNGVWDIAQDYCGGTSSVNTYDPIWGFEMNTRNYPGTTGAGVGYKKNYHWDTRLQMDTFGFNPWELGAKLSTLSTLENPTAASYFSKDYVKKVRSKVVAHHEQNGLFAFNNCLLYDNNGVVQDLSPIVATDGDIVNITYTGDNNALISQYQTPQEGQEMGMLKIKELDPETGNIQTLVNTAVISGIYDIMSFSPQNHFMARFDGDGIINFWQFTANSPGQLLESWDISTVGLANYDLSKSKICLLPSGGDEFYILLWLSQYEVTGEAPRGTVYYSKGNFPLADDDHLSPVVPQIQLSTYPNPARQSLRIGVKMEPRSPHTVEIYNIKGQKVKSFDVSKFQGTYDLDWNGTDDHNAKLGSGIYLIKVNTIKGESITRKVSWIK